MPNNFLIYGANGYTGELIVRYAVERGMKPILAGRNAAKVESLAKQNNLDYRVFALEETEKLDAALREVSFVLHCAGPFSLTSRPMIEACLRVKRHYLDITGEIAVFEGVFARHREAEAAGIALLPGVGFDVVPSDGLAARLAAALPAATSLDLAFGTLGGSWSRGTLATAIEALPATGAIRKDGRLVSVGWSSWSAPRRISWP